MTQNGDVYQNAVAERVNGILKIEFLLNHTFMVDNINKWTFTSSSPLAQSQKAPLLLPRLLSPPLAGGRGVRGAGDLGGGCTSKVYK